jgi:hydrogenase expression/formation protein HypC
MCLGIPAEILEIEGNRARVRVGSTTYSAGLHLVEDVEVGDYILLHSGYAIGTIDRREAEETLRYIEEAKRAADEQEEAGGPRGRDGAE